MTKSTVGVDMLDSSLYPDGVINQAQAQARNPVEVAGSGGQSTADERSNGSGSTIVNGNIYCKGYGPLPAHEAAAAAFSKGKARCRTCTSAYFKDWAAKRNQPGQPSAVAGLAAAPYATPYSDPSADEEAAGERRAAAAVVVPEPTGVEPSDSRTVTTVKRDIGHTYRPNPKLVRLWDAILAASKRGDHLVLAMHGPHGSGKTDAAEYLANRANLPLIKVDAKSMVDAEAWFGTRGAVEGSTFYHPSEFVKAIQMACVLQVDEYTRVTNEVRDVLNPFMDGTRSVLNPITGDRISMHPGCIVVLSGNVGYKYTGVFDVDPATTSRLAVINIDYAEPQIEKSILVEHTGITQETADRLVTLATETRINPQLSAVSTRQLIQSAVLIRDGLSETEAVEAKIINSASDQGDGGSERARLNLLWGGIANTDAPKSVSDRDAEVNS